MKYRKARTQKRTDALFLALNWYLTDQGDIARIDEYIAQAESDVRYTIEEVQAHLAMRYVGRFRTIRLKKKHADDLYWLRQSQLMNTNRV
jgi:hypothetical protein